MMGFDVKNGKWRGARLTRHGALFAETHHIGFVEGREFRAFYDGNLAAGASVLIKVISPVNFVIHRQDFNLVEGELLFEAFTGATDATAFSTPVPIFGKNRTDERIDTTYTNLLTLNSGGTITGGTKVEVVRLKTSGNSNFASTVGVSGTDVRMLPPGTYYLKFTATGVTRFVYNLSWEERLAVVI